MCRFYLLLLIALNVYLAVCEPALKDESIVGGKRSPFCKFNYHVALMYYDSYICGGAIIDERFVITAAHCALEPNNFVARTLTVMASINDLEDTWPHAHVSAVDKVYVLSDYAYNKPLVDIAVLRLKTPIDLKEQECVAKVLIPEYNNYTGQEAIITGFGLEKADVELCLSGELKRVDCDLSGKLNYLQTNITSISECIEMWTDQASTISTDLLNSDGRLICAQAIDSHIKKAGACGGDSGGPLVMKNNILIGVHTQGSIDCDESDTPGIYVSTAYYRNFINRALKNQRKCSVFSQHQIGVCRLPND